MLGAKLLTKFTLVLIVERGKEFQFDIELENFDDRYMPIKRKLRKKRSENITWNQLLIPGRLCCYFHGMWSGNMDLKYS